MGKLLSSSSGGAGTLIANVPKTLSTTALGTIAAIIHIFDPAIQRTCTTIGITRFTSARYTQATVKIINRILVVAAMLGVIAFMLLSHYSAVVADTEIPILGSAVQDISLIFPPVGDSHYPPVTSYNVAPRYRPRTPLLIPFTRNNALMKQTILSYVAGGWPRADIVIIDNSGTMDANNKRMLTPANPFFLDYDLFRQRYGVTIVQTPTLLSFAQLQNFMLRMALARDWPYYFWSHMDVAVLSAEEVRPYKSFYHRVLDVLDASGVDQWSITALPDQQSGTAATSKTHSPQPNRRAVFAGFFDRSENREEPQLQAKKRHAHADGSSSSSSSSSSQTAKQRRSNGNSPRWAERPRWGIKMFAYDYLTMVNTDAWRDIGAWDPFIPYYNTDCDAYMRLKFAGYTTEEVQVGHVFDVAESIDDPEARFFPGGTQRSRNRWGTGPGPEEPAGGAINSKRYQWLKSELNALVDKKTNNPDGRNSWQISAGGANDTRGPGLNAQGKPKRGKQEPWTYDPRAFQRAWWDMADAGREMYVKKWGTLDCDLSVSGRGMDDMWLQEYVEQDSEVWEVRNRGQEHYMGILHDGPIR